MLILDPDAEPELASPLEQALLPDGHAIERAFDKAQALASMARSAPDLIVCNVAGVAGCRIVRALKALPGAAQVPVIMLAGPGSAGAQEARLAQFDAGAEDVLSMPLDPCELRLKVRNLLRLTHALRQAQPGFAQPATASATLASALEGARAQERLSLARELHDELGQRLALLKIDLHHLRAFLPGLGAIDAWQGVDDDVSALTAQIRTIAASLRPAALDQVGLEAALRTLLQRQFADGATHCVFDYAGLPVTLAPLIDSALYRMVQECVTNIVRHAAATRVAVEINGGASGDELELIVRDNGCGFDAGVIHRGNGLRGIEERVQLLGGLFFLDSSAQRGTRVAVHLPLKLPLKSQFEK